jgi:hypothetical protein
MKSLLPGTSAATAVQQTSSPNPISVDKSSPINSIASLSVTNGPAFSQKLTTTVIHPDASSRLTSMDHSSMINNMVVPNIRTGNYVDDNHDQYLPQQDPVPVPVITHDPQTPISEASARNLAQKSSNK